MEAICTNPTQWSTEAKVGAALTLLLPLGIGLAGRFVLKAPPHYVLGAAALGALVPALYTYSQLGEKEAAAVKQPNKTPPGPGRSLQLSPTTTLELKVMDIVKNTDVEAIVNAANEDLQLGGGVAGAIRKADNGTVQRECNAIGHTPTGQAALTSAGKLTKDKLKHIIHAVGPRYKASKHDECAKLLRDAYTNTLALAEKNGIRSLAFPFLSSAIFGFTADKGSSKIALEAVDAYVNAHPNAFDTIRFVSLSASAPYAAFEAQLDLR